MEKEILNFINRFTLGGKSQEVINAFTNGCCYWFAKILLERFSHITNTIIMYDPILNHFGCYINGHIYDITGDVTKQYNWEDWASYASQDELEANRIYRDCIDF